ncbi:class I poly(R)-hydroxyalkanoic acid synthase [Pseudoruegeria sp. SHC-113]|uniref:class I poly(R)-hydroxyalkanoic acid synthase n=1 Tax=Pseudoruegeria sp. SHC-113 TaxID=2855439 RepID=UPI0021BB4247|nr:class I poly(R)-hydroxyalkanoic acid synthase [Pseudoruegeria sp. SHC-113]MCT8159780.1 class I poly(R)-hydroxyalkanoic acid synthase [Pseudoruegeria sp. SHC-113]
MTTDQSDAGPQDVKNLERLNENLAKVEELSQRLVAALSHKRNIDPSLQAPGQDLYMKAATAYMTEMVNNPAKILEHQIAYWGKALTHYVEAQHLLATGKLEAPEDNTPKDPRFKNDLWQTHPYFNYIKQQYMMTSEAIAGAVADVDGLDPKDKKRLEYFSQQIVNMLSPTNFLATNPDALEKAVETEGRSLVAGLENLVRDIEANGGDLLVTLADKDAFKVGENIGTTEGQVVFRNRMFELIQYTPTTEQVHKTPLLIFPPWINKFYIMDLKPANSLIKWIVDQGYTLFIVSWVNPDQSYADVGMDTYIEEGYLTAIEEVKAITEQEKINVVGYCIAGTTLSLTLSLLKKRGDKSINSATFFTTLTDFSDQGEVGVFLDDGFVDGLEAECQENGILDSFFMSRTFSYLRSNDLIYTPAIRSYMMGEAPPAFDLLYWNGDSTNLPGRMAIEYLRGLCQEDHFATKGFEVCGETLHIKDVSVPVCAIACETDHIAAWKSSFNGVKQFGSRSKTFILSESGHIAGIINPPSKKKYGHYTGDAPAGDPDTWKEGASFNEGSWWPTWDAWLSKRSGAKIPARKPGGPKHKPLCAAPGTYVLPKEK